MYLNYIPRPYPELMNIPMYNPYMYWVNPQMYGMYANPYYNPRPAYAPRQTTIQDYGPDPFVFDIDEITERNNTFRTTLWSGTNLQVTLMSLNVGEDIGVEVHEVGDQFIRIEEGNALVRMGDREDNLNLQRAVSDNDAIIIPAGIWHNIINVGNEPLKLYTIYAPPEHAPNTVHGTKADAQASE